MAYHRMVSTLGLGNPKEPILDNKGTINRSFAFDFLKTFLPTTSQACDFSIKDGGNTIMIGIEPTYQYDRMKIISISKDIDKSFFLSGIAWGGYGSNLVYTKKLYNEYKIRSKFIRFVDKWYPKLFIKPIKK
jgi:hypothetical protein